MTVYGNLAGRELLEEKHDMKERMTKLENKLQKTDTELQKTNTRVTDLQNRVKALTLASEGYRKVRHRFLEVYHRDIRNDVDGQGLKKINQGNEAAHHGDAVTDVSLYTSHERNDEIVMTELYGLSVFQISCLGKHQTSLPKFM
jgi:predicted nuclease with TOPRIM domain